MHKPCLILPFLLLASACDGVQSSGTQHAEPVSQHSAQPPPEIERTAEAQTLELQQEDLGIPVLSAPWTGDLDGMEQRRLIRVLTVHGLPRYFLDGVQEVGVTYEFFKLFEKFINKRMGRDKLPVHVVLIPVARDELISGLVKGRGDIAAAGLTITPEREAIIDFSNPVTRALSEVLVTGPSAPDIRSIEDLSGQEVYVRASSSYRSSLDALNRRLGELGKPAVVLRDASEYLEDEDLLEMVNAGMLPWAVVDDYKAASWAQVFEDIVVRDDLVLRDGGKIGYAIRKDSPQLLAALNEFLKDHKEGTLLGNVLINRYVRDFDWSSNALANNDYQRFEEVVGVFERFGRQYGFDYLLVTAQGYQESRLDQSRVSHAGAIGIMQLLPSTASDQNVGIPDISTAENNIHAGVKYMEFVRRRYFGDLAADRFNQTLFALAAYNAGPNRIRSLRAKAAEQGYDPDRWFDNVEVVVAREVGREPVTYVANIVKYYAAYSLSIARQQQRGAERERVMQDG